ncbi:MAG: 30S ribosomal protein S6 [Proteobacteria bacterium]|nr:30S ribosomal protein S6 [Pseudomonadota bacterium]
MRHYEIVVLVSAEQHERGTTMAERYKNMISEDGGSVHRFEDWGSRRLAYPINKRLRARYFLFNVECNAETLAKLKDDFRYSESVVRTLVIRRESAIVEESPVMVELKKQADAEEAANEESGKEDKNQDKGDKTNTGDKASASDKENNKENDDAKKE